MNGEGSLSSLRSRALLYTSMDIEVKKPEKRRN
jgi:hypothetical protein